MEHQFVEAGTLMLAGMVFVFIFLSLLIIFINTVLAKLAVIFPDSVAPTRTHSNNKIKSSKAVNDGVSPAIVAAISGAVNSYRKQKSQRSAQKQK